MKLKVNLSRPHKRQLEFLNSKAKRKVVRAGRRGGKTVGVSILAVQSFLNGRRVLYAAPTQDQVDAFWESCKRALQEPIDAGIYYKNETRHIIEQSGTRQRIRAKTAWNADTLRGDSADILILDEYQIINEDAWAIVGAPMLLDNDGDAIFVYTPPSFRTAGVSKARDKNHASKLFNMASSDISGRWQTFHFSSHDNPHISTTALQDITSDMTSIAYRQEILAEDVDEIPGAMWNRQTIDDNRVFSHPSFVRIIVGVDPKASALADSKTGIIVVGIDSDKNIYVVDDCSIDSTPESWGTQVVSAYHRWQADNVVAEVNQGGDMVVSVISTIDATVPVKSVRASRGKATRAEPVAALYEKGLVHHVGQFENLEGQMCSWVPGDKSPDEVDALVWAITEIALNSNTSGSAIVNRKVFGY